MKRQVYCVGLRKKVEAEIDDIIAIDGKRGTKYQGIGSYTEESTGKTYTIKSWVSKSDYENMHGKVLEVVSEVVSEPQVMEVMAAESEEFIGANKDAADPLAADPVAESPVADDSSTPQESAPASNNSYFLSEDVVADAMQEMDAEVMFEATMESIDMISEARAVNAIESSPGIKGIVVGPTYLRFLGGSSSKYHLFAVVERVSGSFQAVNAYGRRGGYPTVWTSPFYSTANEATRAMQRKMKTKTRKGYDKMGAEEFFAWMAEDQAVTVSEVSNAEGSAGDQIVSWENDAGVSSPSSPPNNIMWAESPLEESPLTENPSTDGPSDMGGPEDFSADVDLEDGEKLTIEKEGGRSKKVLVGLLMLGGLYAAWSQSDAILDFYEKVVGDDSSEVEGCMDETAENYNPDATVDDGSCNGGTNGTPEDNEDSDDSMNGSV
jgi:hypothetical protein